MPLASLIGSGMGILNPWNLQLIIEQATVPVIVDAGVGTASDAAIAMELGCAGVLMNTAIAAARDPVMMARAMKLGVEAGRLAWQAGRMPKKTYSASPSSPAEGLLTSVKLSRPRRSARACAIRSYVLRRSHFSPAQRDAYERLMPRFGVPASRAPLDLPAVFGRQAPVILEIGFGMGDTTAEIAERHPERRLRRRRGPHARRRRACCAGSRRGDWPTCA